MSGQTRPRALSALQRLEARVETLEFLVLALMRAGRDQPALQRNVLATFDVMQRLLEMPEINKSAAYRKQCIALFQDALALAWDDWGMDAVADAQGRSISSLQ